jgi:hypothetical protein
MIGRKDDIVGVFILSLSCFQRNWQFGPCFHWRQSLFPFERSLRLNGQNSRLWSTENTFILQRPKILTKWRCGVSFHVVGRSENFSYFTASFCTTEELMNYDCWYLVCVTFESSCITQFFFPSVSQVQTDKMIVDL